jgi:hypothetical protein
MGRTGASDLQLRHQRSADVLFGPVEAGGRVPEATYVVLETLLPGRGPGLGAGEEAPRLLELDLRGANCAARPGWTRVVRCVPP